MKGFKKSLSLLLIAAMLVLFPGANALTAHADGPNTYYAKYNSAEGDWLFQIGKWDDAVKGTGSYYLNNGETRIKDGDSMAVMPGDGQIPPKDLVVNVRLNTLTINRTSAAVKTNGIDECYVLGDSYAAINGAVTNAYVYDKTTCTFNDNIDTLTINNTQKNVTEVTLSTAGTVGHVIEIAGAVKTREIYSVAAGKLIYTEGRFDTKAEHYTYTAPADAKPAAANAASPTVTAPAQTPAATAPSADEYIVKRGDSLSRIARANGLTLKEIVALNPQIKNINLIYAGQRIKLK